MPLHTTPRRIEIYQKRDGSMPYRLWIESLKDKRSINRIDLRVRRMEIGLFGDHRHLGAGVYELRLFFGPGYRVYFAKRDSTIIVLLSGGDKSTQHLDIEQAKQYWKDFKERSK